MQQQKLEDALHEAHKPLARHCDDEDLDRMLREQEREGDPMAAMLRRKKDRSAKTQGFKGYICVPCTLSWPIQSCCLPLAVYIIVNHLIFVLQTNLDIKAQHPLQTASILHQVIAGMELTGNTCSTTVVRAILLHLLQLRTCVYDNCDHNFGCYIKVNLIGSFTEGLLWCIK